MTTYLNNTTITERHLASILADVLTEHEAMNMKHESKLLERIGIDWKVMLDSPFIMETARTPSWKFPYSKMLSFIDSATRSRIGDFEDEIYNYI